MAYSKAAKMGDLLMVTDEELQHLLITPDGLGGQIKRNALDLLLKKAYSRGVLGISPPEIREISAQSTVEAVEKVE